MITENQAELAEEQGLELEEAPRVPRVEKPRPPKRQGTRKRPRNQPWNAETVLARFSACGRCAYFLLSYQSIAGQDVLATAVANSDDEWLQLPWVDQMPTLVEKSYGLSIDLGDYYAEVICPLCQRPFAFTAETAEFAADLQMVV